MVQTIIADEEFIDAYHTLYVRMNNLRQNNFEALSNLYHGMRALQTLEPFSFAFGDFDGVPFEEALECIEYHYWHA